ncbi:MAG: glycosyltransferase [Acidobacteria bacterium]|nr:glycosyltransferase [Acidobacteriota bacterium]
MLSELRPGGMERLVVHLAEELAGRAIAVEVICLESPGALAPLLGDKGVPVVSLESHGSRDAAALLRLRNELKRFQSTHVHLHDYASLPYAALANLCGGRKLVFTAHGLLYEGFEPLRRRLRFFARFLDGVSAVSEEVADRHREFLGWNGPIPVIANGVPAAAADEGARQRVRGELGCSEDVHLFLAVGNPRPEKGFEDLLEAAALLREETDRFLVAIAGTLNDSEYCRDLMARLQQLNLGNYCRFLGFRQDTAALYSAADSLVLSSRSEGLPMVILEAMTAGLPVIATRVGGIPDAVGDCGLLVEARDPCRFSQAMFEMMRNPGTRRNLAAAGKSHAAKYFGIGRMVDQYLAWYEQILNQR